METAYSIRKRALHCEACGGPFKEGADLFSQLVFENGEWLRLDYCTSCTPARTLDPVLSRWKTVFIVPPPPKPEPLHKDNAESLLRRLMEAEAQDHTCAIYILAVMLERKRILVERDVQTDVAGRKIRIYEHRKTGEMFVIHDPALKLNDLEPVQQEIADLLGPDPAATSSPATEDSPVEPPSGRE
jgi:hypothetical protein